MKYVLLILDGAADLPLPALGDRTPLDYANTPYMDRLAVQGRCGFVSTIPEAFVPGSDVAILSLLGYDPALYYAGRAPLEAAAQELPLSKDEWVFRCNLVRLENATMKDYSAGSIPTGEARVLVELLNKNTGDMPVKFFSGVGYRNLMSLRGEGGAITTPPHDILDKPYIPHLPRGRGAGLLVSLMERSQEILSARPSQANSIWLWGQGRLKTLPSFKERFGLQGAVITAVDLVRGIGRLVGWHIIDVPGATGYYDTDYLGKGRGAAEALRSHDFVCVHVEAPDEAGHEGNPKEKVRSIEMIDHDIVQPLIQDLRTNYSDWRVLFLPDHPTPCLVRTHTRDPVPFCIAGTDVRPDRAESYHEQLAPSWNIERGHELMALFFSTSLNS
jgi:2,3-bisphosphoglycerate-independent phosphoglycerate mutase